MTAATRVEAMRLGAVSATGSPMRENSDMTITVMPATAMV